MHNGHACAHITQSFVFIPVQVGRIIDSVSNSYNYFTQNESVDFSISYYIFCARLYEYWIPLRRKIKTDNSLRSRNYINM